MDSLYTEEIIRLMYQAKAELEPFNFPLITSDEGYYILIDIPMKHFAWRPVEGKGGRLEIATIIENLRNKIKETGIPCFVQKI